MKKKFFIAMGVAAFAVAIAFNINTGLKNDIGMDLTLANVEALARNEQINPECPNGCHENGGGCYCYADYPSYREHAW